MAKSDGGFSLYGVGFVGALVYYLQAAASIGAVFTALIKAMIWPAIVVYKFLESFYGVV